MNQHRALSRDGGAPIVDLSLSGTVDHFLNEVECGQDGERTQMLGKFK